MAYNFGSFLYINSIFAISRKSSYIRELSLSLFLSDSSIEGFLTDYLISYKFFKYRQECMSNALEINDSFSS